MHHVVYTGHVSGCLNDLFFRMSVFAIFFSLKGGLFTFLNVCSFDSTAVVESGKDGLVNRLILPVE